MKVLVAGGGISSEREVSLKSGKMVFEAGKTAGHDMTFYDWNGLEDWLINHAAEFDVILPIQHGTGAEDGVIQKILEKTNTPFLGSSSEASELCFDKQKSREKYKSIGIRVAEGLLLTFEEYKQSDLAKKPHVLKPNQDGSSVGVILVRDIEQKPQEEITQAFSRRKVLLIEEFLDGVEITVPVLDGKELPIIKIVPPEGKTFDYENKYNGSTEEIVDPGDIEGSVKEQARLLGKKIHQELGCRHLSRTDMMVCNGEIYVLETNTMPGMTDQSLFPKAAAAVGLDYPALVDYFIKLVASSV